LVKRQVTIKSVFLEEVERKRKAVSSVYFHPVHLYEYKSPDRPRGKTFLIDDPTSKGLLIRFYR